MNLSCYNFDINDGTITLFLLGLGSFITAVSKNTTKTDRVPGYLVATYSVNLKRVTNGGL
jgi:hypothetical protein